MLSAVIPSELSYPAMLLAEQLVGQRFVHSGPLVTFYPPISRRVDYTFTLSLHKEKWGGDMLPISPCSSSSFPEHISLFQVEQVVTGSNLKHSVVLLLSSYVWQRNFDSVFQESNQPNVEVLLRLFSYIFSEPKSLTLRIKLAPELF